MTLWLWLAFLIVVGTLIVIDLGLVTRRPRIVSPVEALLSFSLWVLAAVGFSVLVWYVYQTDWMNIESALAEAMLPPSPSPLDLDGHTAWTQWATAYVLEVALSLDNIAIAALLLRHFKIPRPLVGRTLFWSVLISLVLRLAMLLAGAALLRNVAWVTWAFCGLLVLAMLRTLLAPDEHTDFSRKWPVRLVRRFVPVSQEHHGQRLFARVDGRLGITPIMLVVLVSCAADLSFAIDSVPAMFAVTRDPFLAFSASAFAILGLRSLYFALIGVLGRFRYLRVSLVFVLLAVAGKMFLVSSDPAFYAIRPTVVLLAIVSGIIAVGVGASALRDRTRALPALEETRPTPLEDLTDAVDVSRRNFRKVVILIVGSAIVLIAAPLVGFLPGPGGILVAIAGLALLATEFVWAKRLLDRVKRGGEAMAQRADKVAARTNPWLIPVIVIGSAAATAAVAHYGPFSTWTVWISSLGLWIPLGYWAWKTIASARAARRGTPSTAGKIDPAHAATKQDQRAPQIKSPPAA